MEPISSVGSVLIKGGEKPRLGELLTDICRSMGEHILVHQKSKGIGSLFPKRLPPGRKMPKGNLFDVSASQEPHYAANLFGSLQLHSPHTVIYVGSDKLADVILNSSLNDYYWEDPVVSKEIDCVIEPVDDEVFFYGDEVAHRLFERFSTLWGKQ